MDITGWVLLANIFFGQNAKKSSRFLAFRPKKYFEAKLEIQLTKISAKFSFLAILKIPCKNIEK